MKKLLFIFIFITSICYAQDFSDPVNISVAGQDAFTPQLVIDSNNNIVAIWYRSDGLNYIIQSSTSIDQGVSWSTPVNLSVAGQDATDPQLAIDSNNNIVAIWARSNGTNTIIQSSTSTDQGANWSTPVNLSEVAQDAATPQLAIDSNNNIVAIWERNGTIQSSVSTDQGGNWSPPVDISVTALNAETPQLAIDSNNNIVAIWQGLDGANYRIQSSTSTDQGANWSEPFSLSEAGQNASSPQMAIDSNNNIVAIWQIFNGANFIVKSSTSTDQGANWSAPFSLSKAVENASSAQLAIDSNNNIVAIWRGLDGANYIIKSSISTDQGGNWSTPIKISEAGKDAETPQLAIDSNNNIVAIWTGSDGANTIIQSSTSTDQGGNWSTPVNLSLTDQSAANPQLAIDSNNNIVAIWYRSNGTNTIIQSSTKLFFSFKKIFFTR